MILEKMYSITLPKEVGDLDQLKGMFDPDFPPLS